MRPKVDRYLHRNPYKQRHVREALSLIAEHPWPDAKRSEHIETDVDHMADVISSALDAYAGGEIQLEKALRLVQAFSVQFSSVYSRENVSIEAFEAAVDVRERVLVGVAAELALGIVPKPLGEQTPKIPDVVRHLAAKAVLLHLHPGDSRDTAAQSIADFLRLCGLADVKAGTVETWTRNYNKLVGQVRIGRPPKLKTRR